MKKYYIILFGLFWLTTSALAQNVGDPCKDPDEDEECEMVGGCDPNMPDSTEIDRVHAVDPNDIIGPIGYDTAQWMSIKDQFSYTIRFENDPEFATAPAQIVRINSPVGPKLNINSVALGDFGFGEHFFTPPPNSPFYAERLDLRDELNIFVDVTAGVDIVNNEVFWIFESIDPLTGLAPSDAFTGFLPVNDTSVTIYTDTTVQQGEGFVSFTIYPELTDNTGDSVHQDATIIFDDNEAIPTNRWMNIIDALPPTTMMDSLPEIVDTNLIALSWNSIDDAGGVGVGMYDLYVSQDSGQYFLFASNLDTNYFEFSGVNGVCYAFYIRAKDHVKNEEAQKFIEDAFTKVGADIIVEAKILLQGSFNPSTNLMNDDLRSMNLIPLQSPYLISNFAFADNNNTTTQSVMQKVSADGIVDWAYVELILTSTNEVVAGSSALVQRDGDLVMPDGVSPIAFENLEDGNYALAIYHRNHLPIKSKGVDVIRNQLQVLNLTNDISVFIGGFNAVREISGTYTLIAGDIDGNGEIQNKDYLEVLVQIGNSGYTKYDLNMDGEVRQNEIQNYLIPNIGKGSQF